ncbi:gamma-glutamyl-gamma-aminobutyrate hydrolase family protein [Rickettsiales bacterium]|nr:gamma-glutamyl-gamma-aminobutyrate hydrolase family protein [Rickettsiales bacterium]
MSSAKTAAGTLQRNSGSGALLGLFSSITGSALGVSSFTNNSQRSSSSLSAAPMAPNAVNSTVAVAGFPSNSKLSRTVEETSKAVEKSSEETKNALLIAAGAAKTPKLTNPLENNSSNARGFAAAATLANQAEEEANKKARIASLRTSVSVGLLEFFKTDDTDTTHIEEPDWLKMHPEKLHKTTPNDLSKLAEEMFEKSQADGLVVPGSPQSIHDALINKEKLSQVSSMDLVLAKTIFRLKVVEEALKAFMPVLASCNGVPYLIALSGGDIIPIENSPGGKQMHHILLQDRGSERVIQTPTHDVIIPINSWLHKLAGKTFYDDKNITEKMIINDVCSTHPYCSRDVPYSNVIAYAEDGTEAIIEFFKSANAYALGIIDHPEQPSFISDHTRQLFNAIADLYIQRAIYNRDNPDNLKKGELQFDEEVMDFLDKKQFVKIYDVNPSGRAR